MRVPAEQIRQQLVSVLRAWGMSDAHADTTAEMMLIACLLTVVSRLR